MVCMHAESKVGAKDIPLTKVGVGIFYWYLRIVHSILSVNMWGNEGSGDYSRLDESCSVKKESLCADQQVPGYQYSTGTRDEDTETNKYVMTHKLELRSAR